MQSWRLLQLEPSSLRKSDTFTAPTKLGNDGSHLAATLYRLGRAENVQGQAYAQVAGRLSQLINDVRQVSVDRDDRRELLTALVTSRDGTTHTARALSDGTLRFLALAVLEQDPEMSGTLCLEEPENGIHPARIPAMVTLLQDIAVDLEMPVSDDNPLRQVIVNTHAPLVVQNVPDDSLVYAELRETVRDGQHVERAVFSYLSDTWRERAAQDDEKPVTLASKGHLLNYLRTASVIPSISTPTQSANSRRVIERSDLQLLLFDPMEN
jgi:predicted ATPase